MCVPVGSLEGACLVLCAGDGRFDGLLGGWALWAVGARIMVLPRYWLISGGWVTSQVCFSSPRVVLCSAAIVGVLAVGLRGPFNQMPVPNCRVAACSIWG